VKNEDATPPSASDYMNFNGVEPGIEQYPVKYYTDFLEYIKSRYANQYWNVLPIEIAQHCRDHFTGPAAGGGWRQKLGDK
jgi:hypothetical protein